MYKPQKSQRIYFIYIINYIYIYNILVMGEEDPCTVLGSKKIKLGKYLSHKYKQRANSFNI